jgi:hypothetical protein
MDRLPYVLMVATGAMLGVVLVTFLMGRSAGDILYSGISTAVIWAVVHAGFLRWRGLPLDISLREYNRHCDPVTG